MRAEVGQNRAFSCLETSRYRSEASTLPPTGKTVPASGRVAVTVSPEPVVVKTSDASLTVLSASDTLIPTTNGTAA